MTETPAIARYNRFLQFVAGLGGLLYGIDVGIIGGALPYLEATSRLSAAELSAIVAAVLLGSVFSTLFAGLLADWMGRKPLMIVSGAAFLASIPVIALSHGYTPLMAGRLLQGMSGGVVGVVVPLYLAECLTADKRGRGTAIFQWMLTLGIFAAALVGIFFSYRVQAVAALDPAGLFHYKDQVWRSIFWVSMPPGLLFVLGACFVAESPRWLMRRQRESDALASLLRSRTPQQAAIEIAEMRSLAAKRHDSSTTKTHPERDSLFQRKYIVPFLLACLILSCNTATGVNSIIGFCTSTLLQSGLSDLASHWGYVLLTSVNFAMTMVGIFLVDRKGRKFLLSIGTAGIILSLTFVGLLFHQSEKRNIDVRAALQARIPADQQLTLAISPSVVWQLIHDSGLAPRIDPQRAALAVIYSCGDFSAATSYVRSDDPAARPIQMDRDSCLPANRVEAFFRQPFSSLRFGSLDASRRARLVVTKAILGPIPDPRYGLLVAIGLYCFMASYALGPGVCVWLALSELMPTRIRSNGMSIALVINQLVSATLAAIFLPFVSQHGYAQMFFFFASTTVVYFVVATFFLPETRGKTLEEIEAHFARSRS